MTWHCSVCGQPVGDGDMVGYFKDRNGRYIPGTLGFWHCNPVCGRRDHVSMDFSPSDTHIQGFQQRMPQFLALFAWEANSEEFRRDCAAFILRCLVNGYDEVLPFINEAKDEGVIESNLPDNLLWDNEVQAILNWKRNGGM